MITKIEFQAVKAEIFDVVLLDIQVFLRHSGRLESSGFSLLPGFRVTASLRPEWRTSYSAEWKNLEHREL
jgi:hypothetical protein